MIDRHPITEALNKTQSLLKVYKENQVDSFISLIMLRVAWYVNLPNKSSAQFSDPLEQTR